MTRAENERVRSHEADVRDLVERATRGDATAFGQLYDRHIDSIYRYVYYRVGSPAEAEDLTEEIFLRAWEAIGRFRWQGAPFSAWLFRLAHNRVVDHRRSRRPETELLETEPARTPDPETIVGERLDWERAIGAMRELTPDQQEILTLKFIEGLDNREIVEVTGKSEGAIRAIQFRALSALRAILQPEEK